MPSVARLPLLFNTSRHAQRCQVTIVVQYKQTCPALPGYHCCSIRADMPSVAGLNLMLVEMRCPPPFWGGGGRGRVYTIFLAKSSSNKFNKLSQDIAPKTFDLGRPRKISAIGGKTATCAPINFSFCCRFSVNEKQPEPGINVLNVPQCTYMQFSESAAEGSSSEQLVSYSNVKSWRYPVERSVSCRDV